jgi:hypothetical protein
MSKQYQRYWVGNLTEYNRSTSIVLYDRKSPNRSEDEVYLYNHKRNQIINYLRSEVRPRLKPLDDENMVYLVTEAYRRYKEAYFKELCKHLDGREGFELPGYESLRYFDPWLGKQRYELFYGDTDWDLSNREPDIK